MRWNVCASAVRSCPCGAFGTTITTHTLNISLCCALGCGKKSPPKNTTLYLQNNKIRKSAFKESNQTALRTTHWHANNLATLVVHFGTHTNTNTHYTGIVASKHRSFALPTQRSWCVRWNVCAYAVRSWPGGAFGTMNTTHTKKHFTSVCPRLRKKIPS